MFIYERQQGLNWVFGCSTHVKNGVVNLSDGYSDRICYVAAHTGIIYDKKIGKQIFLQVRCVYDAVNTMR